MDAMPKNKIEQRYQYQYQSLVSHLSVDVEEEEKAMLPSIAIPTRGVDATSKETKFYNLAMVGEFLVCLVMSGAGVYGAKVFQPSEEYVRSRPVPLQQLSNGDIILDFDLNHPVVRPPMVPTNMLVHTSIWLPIMMIALFTVIFPLLSGRTKICWQDLHAAVCALLVTVGTSEGFTQMIKYFVLRRRPNFYQLCEFSLETQQCEGPFYRVKESMFSFPSGHASLSFSGMTFLVWFLLGRLGVAASTTKSPKKILRLAACVVPWGYSTFVGASRIVDHWHHVDDVLAGCLIGLACATVSYHLYYPHVFSRFAGLPMAIISVHGGSAVAEKLPSFNA